MKIKPKLLTAWLALAWLGCRMEHRERPVMEVKNTENIKNIENKNQIIDGEIFFLLIDQKIVPAQKTWQKGFYIRGEIKNDKFIPKSQILGMGEMASKGQYGWLELNSKNFYPMESGQKATTPFVKGYMTDDGFLPSMREVFEEP